MLDLQIGVAQECRIVRLSSIMLHQELPVHWLPLAAVSGDALVSSAHQQLLSGCRNCFCGVVLKHIPVWKVPVWLVTTVVVAR